MYDERGIKGEVLKEIIDLMDGQMLSKFKGAGSEKPDVMSVEVATGDMGESPADMAEEQLDPGLAEELARMYEELE